MEIPTINRAASLNLAFSVFNDARRDAMQLAGMQQRLSELSPSCNGLSRMLGLDAWFCGKKLS